MGSDINILTIFGSGETSPYMAKTYRFLFDIYPNFNINSPVILNTPSGFQENSKIIGEKIFDYFEKRLNIKPVITSLNSDSISDLTLKKVTDQIKHSDFIFSGPGSPTYALKIWKSTKIDKLLKSKISQPGIIAFASAAALTLGTYALPVYEIYKVGMKPYWEKGLDLTKFLGIKTIILPHYNNREGGDHDTSYCFIGEKRFKKLLEKLPNRIIYIGIDEHTACIFNLNKGSLTVKGKGQVHIGSKSKIFSLNSGESVKSNEILSKLKMSYNLKTVSTYKRKIKNTINVQKVNDNKSPNTISMEISHLLEIRKIARLNKNWNISDKIRSILASKGIEIKDTPEKTFWEENS